MFGEELTKNFEVVLRINVKCVLQKRKCNFCEENFGKFCIKQEKICESLCEFWRKVNLVSKMLGNSEDSVSNKHAYMLQKCRNNFLEKKIMIPKNYDCVKIQEKIRGNFAKNFLKISGIKKNCGEKLPKLSESRRIAKKKKEIVMEILKNFQNFLKEAVEILKKDGKFEGILRCMYVFKKCVQ